jgi:hypothetical protein
MDFDRGAPDITYSWGVGGGAYFPVNLHFYLVYIQLFPLTKLDKNLNCEAFHWAIYSIFFWTKISLSTPCSNTP